MTEKSEKLFCILYCMRRGLSKDEAEKFADVILIGYKKQTSKTLKQMCDFSIEVLGDMKRREEEQEK